MMPKIHHSPNNFLYLLIGLLVMLIVAPLAVGRFEGVVGLAFTVMMVTSVWSLAKRRIAYIIGWTLAGLSLLVAVLEFALDVERMTLVGVAVAFVFCANSMKIVLGEVVFGRHLNANRIAGAVCVYLLIGLNWAFLYEFIYHAAPLSFDGLPPASEAQFLTLLYYSFVTLTTLGYGDISPVSHLARALAYLEAVSGVMYVAILIASLVGAPERGKSTES